MLGWIPLLGPIFQGIFSIFTKMQDNAIIKYKTDATRDVQEAQISAQIIQTTQDDIGLRIIRDGICVLPAVWTALVSWDTIVALRWPNLMVHVSDFPPNVGYIPYAVMVFLLGNIGINAWKRR